MNIFPTTGDWLAVSVQRDYRTRAAAYRRTLRNGADPGRVAGFWATLRRWGGDLAARLQGDRHHPLPPPTALHGGAV